MDLLAKILASDPTTPRLTVYDENTGARLDFSGITLDNWAAKVANMLIEELDLTEDSLISIDLPPGWQAVAVALGALAADIPVTLFDAATSDVVFIAENDVQNTAGNAVENGAAGPGEYSGDVVIVTDDPLAAVSRRLVAHYYREPSTLAQPYGFMVTNSLNQPGHWQIS